MLINLQPTFLVSDVQHSCVNMQLIAYSIPQSYFIHHWSRGSVLALVPKFAGSNPAEAVGFFRAKKSSARLPSEGK